MEHSPTFGLSVFLFVVALVLFLMGGIPWNDAPPSPWGPWRLRFISLGLFCWALSTYFAH
jgi:hypothetical protein